MVSVNIQEKYSELCVGVDFGTTYSAICLYRKNNFEFVRFENDVTLLPSNRYKNISIKQIISDMSLADQVIEGIPYMIEDDKLISIVDIAGDFFRHLRFAANRYFHDNVKYCMISLPARFHQIQRQIICNAAHKGGWKVLSILTEPAAAIIGETLPNQNARYLVYDLGGGTFDIALVQVKQNIFHVLKTNGDLNLGGEHIDALSAQIGKENAIKELIPQTIQMVNEMLTEYGKVIRINGILCVGGATHLARQYLKKLNKKLICAPEPSLSVVKGLARYAAAEYIRLIDVSAFDIGIGMWGGGVEWLIKKNTPLPAVGKCIFTNVHQSQTSIEFTIIQNEINLGKFDLDIEPTYVGGVQIEAICILHKNSMIEFIVTNLNKKTVKKLEFKAIYI